MRPCNQCGKATENSRIVCEACEDVNEELGRIAEPSVKLNAEKLSAQPEDVPYDESMLILSILFNVVVALLGGFIGLYIGGATTAVTGVLVAIVVANIWIRLFN